MIFLRIKIDRVYPVTALEPPADHKGAATAIIVVFAFFFAVAGVFIGVYFRVERVLKCIDRIGGSNSLDTEALIDRVSHVKILLT